MIKQDVHATSSEPTTSNRTFRLALMVTAILLLSYVSLIVAMNRPYGGRRYDIRRDGMLVGTLHVQLPIDFFPLRRWHLLLTRSVTAVVTIDYPTNAKRAYSGTTPCVSYGFSGPVFFEVSPFLYTLPNGRSDGVVQFYEIDSTWQRLYRETLTEIH